MTRREAILVASQRTADLVEQAITDETSHLWPPSETLDDESRVRYRWALQRLSGQLQRRTERLSGEPKLA